MSLIELAYKYYVRPFVFANSQEDPETAHEWGLAKLESLQSSRMLTALARAALVYNHPMLETRVFNLDFPNPLGLAAGFDKYCQVYHRAVPACGWGFTEVGGITKFEQPGNPRPRMWRSADLGAMCNYMGFNNPGADKAHHIMSRTPVPSVPVGLNIGKSRDTPIEQAASDYSYTISSLWRFVDFFTINPSSPNTAGLRTLQSKTNLLHLVRIAQDTNWAMARRFNMLSKPLGVKISPDEGFEQLSDIVEVCKERRVHFIVTTNTTVNRDGLAGWNIPADRGGVSGRPLRQRSLAVQREVYRQVRGRIPIIGVGGISDGNDLFDRIVNGASLCQVYTAWPFEGPDFVKRCLKQLVQMLKVHGYKNVSEAVGQAV